MAGEAIAIADKIVLAINAKSDYSNSLTPAAVRKLLINARINREDVSGLTCYVIPGSFEARATSEQTFLDDYTSRIFVIDKISKTDNSNDWSETEIQNRLTLIQEMQTQVVQYAESEANGLTLINQYTSNPIFDNEFLETGVFLSVTEFQFRHYREV